MHFRIITFIVGAVLALGMGLYLSTPDSLVSWMMVVLVIGALSIPFLLHSHHRLLILSWNAPVAFFFLPGAPYVWMLLTFATCLIGGVGYSLRRNANRSVSSPKHWPVVIWTLLAFVVVVFITAVCRGGIGFSTMGSSTAGGKKYFIILGAALGYFALASERIPLKKKGWCIALFFAGTLSMAVSNLIYYAGEGFFWLYSFFPVTYAMDQAVADYNVNTFARLAGVAFAMVGPWCWMLARYGFRGIFDLSKPWRLLVCLAILSLTLLGGFRSLLIMLFLISVFQLYFEGLFRPKLILALVALGTLAFIILMGTSDRLPLPVQRSLSFLPVHVDPVAKADAEDSSEWRMKMWSVLADEIPRYLLLGKGYSVNAMDLYLAQYAQQNGKGDAFEEQMLAGNYHSGPLTVLISFGIPGTVFFIAFCSAAMYVLFLNYRHGESELRGINTLLLACFVGRFVFYWTFYGDVVTDFPVFCGLLGMGVALNGRIQPRSPKAHEILNHHPKLA